LFGGQTGGFTDGDRRKRLSLRPRGSGENQLRSDKEQEQFAWRDHWMDVFECFRRHPLAQMKCRMA